METTGVPNGISVPSSNTNCSTNGIKDFSHPMGIEAVICTSSCHVCMQHQITALKGLILVPAAQSFDVSYHDFNGTSPDAYSTERPPRT